MMPHPDFTKLWSQVFLDGFTAIPSSRMTKSFDEPNELRLLDSNKIQYGRFWRPSSSEHPMSIRLACMHEHFLIVKQFNNFTDKEAEAQLNRRPAPGYSLEQVKRDMDTFILEQQAYQRIESACSEGEKSFFPKYYGTIGNCNKTERAIALELLKSSLRSRCICSNSIPSYFMEDLQLLRDDIKAVEAGSGEGGTKPLFLPLEIQWYESLFLDCLKRLRALHSVGITHGDIKEDHFRLPGDFHDTALLEFSRAYTFTPRRPYMVNSHAIYSSSANRLSTFPSLQRIVKMERNHVRELIRDRIQNHSFRKYFSVHYDLSVEQLASHPACQHLDLIAIKVYRAPDEFGFPSLASLLPFLEEASSKTVLLDCLTFTFYQ